MAVPQPQQEFKNFMEDYTCFLEDMADDENEKLDALNSWNLERIERSIAVSQANAKKLDNCEAKRISLQEDIGFAGMTFKDIIGQSAPADQGRLRQLFERFESAIAEIRFHNDKSMAVARDHMLQVNPDAVLPTGKGAPANPYSQIRDKENKASSILEKKI